MRPPEELQMYLAAARRVCTNLDFIVTRIKHVNLVPPL